MDSDRIVRDDFPVIRKGWDPDAVRDHLREVAEEVESSSQPPSMSQSAAAGVRSVLDVAERMSEQLGEEAQAVLADARSRAESGLEAAREEAESMLAAAQEEADSTLSSARSEARTTLSSAKAKAETTLSTAEEEAATRLSTAEEAADSAVKAARQQAATTLWEAQEEASSTQAESEEAAAAALTTARDEADSLVEAARTEAEDLREGVSAERAEAEAELSSARGEADSIRSEARGDAESLSADAREEAERSIAQARAEGEQIVAAASEESRRQIEEVESAIAELISHAQELGRRVGHFGDELVDGLGDAAPRSEHEEPTLPGLVSVAGPGAEAQEGESAAEELQVTGGRFDRSAESATAAADVEEARMIASSMALEGHSRDVIVERLEADFGSIDDLEAILESVQVRLGR